MGVAFLATPPMAVVIAKLQGKMVDMPTKSHSLLSRIRYKSGISTLNLEEMR